MRQSSPTHSGKSEQQGDSDRASGPDTPPKGLPQAAAAQRRLDSAGAPDFSGDSSTTTWDEATSPAAASGACLPASTIPCEPRRLASSEAPRARDLQHHHISCMRGGSGDTRILRQ